jgi:hypothetical protein
VRRAGAWSGAAAVALFALGLLFADVIASPSYPAIDASGVAARSWFADNAADARWLGFWHGLAALALIVFVSRLHGHTRGPRRPIVRTTGLAGGFIAASFLLLSAFLYVLGADPIVKNPSVFRAVLLLSWLCGGPGVLVPLGVMIASTTGDRDLPRWLRRAGLFAAVLGVASLSVVLVAPSDTSVLFGVLLAAAITGLAWMLTASIVLGLRI